MEDDSSAVTRVHLDSPSVCVPCHLQYLILALTFCALDLTVLFGVQTNLTFRFLFVSVFVWWLGLGLGLGLGLHWVWVWVWVACFFVFEINIELELEPGCNRRR